MSHTVRAVCDGLCRLLVRKAVVVHAGLLVGKLFPLCQLWTRKMQAG